MGAASDAVASGHWPRTLQMESGTRKVKASARHLVEDCRQKRRFVSVALRLSAAVVKDHCSQDHQRLRVHRHPPEAEVRLKGLLSLHRLLAVSPDRIVLARLASSNLVPVLVPVELRLAGPAICLFGTESHAMTGPGTCHPSVAMAEAA